MLNWAITFQRREDVVLVPVCVLCAANWKKKKKKKQKNKKKKQPKYRVVFQEHTPESFHFTQVLEIAQLEHTGMEKNSPGKKKIMN